MARKMRKRVSTKLTAEQAEHFRRSRAEAEAERDTTRAESRARAGLAVRLSEVVQAIRAERLRMKLSASFVAERLQMDTGNYARLEGGQGNPTLETVTRLAEAVGVEVSVRVKPKV